MAKLVTYFYARQQLDAAVERLRLEVELTVEKMVQAGWRGFRENEEKTDDNAVRGMVAAYRECAHRQILLAWISGIAALVALVRPQTSGRSRVIPVSTRNRRAKKSGRRKAFPSDSHQRGEHGGYERTQGHRARFRLRYLGTFTKAHGKARGLPKLALLEEQRKGRPEVPTLWRGYRRRVARAKQLEKQRAATAQRRQEKGWNAYPADRVQSRGRDTGWSNPFQWRSAPAVMGILRDKIHAANVDYLRRISAKKRKQWEDAH